MEIPPSGPRSVDADASPVVIEVQVEELTVGGAIVGFANTDQVRGRFLSELQLFVDLGPDEHGDRIAATLEARLVWLEVSVDASRCRALLMWSETCFTAAWRIERLMVQLSRVGLPDATNADCGDAIEHELAA
mgnify:CR=1 FL=1